MKNCLAARQRNKNRPCICPDLLPSNCWSDGAPPQSFILIHCWSLRRKFRVGGVRGLIRGCVVCFSWVYTHSLGACVAPAVNTSKTYLPSVFCTVNYASLVLMKQKFCTSCKLSQQLVPFLNLKICKHCFISSADGLFFCPCCWQWQSMHDTGFYFTG